MPTRVATQHERSDLTTTIRYIFAPYTDPLSKYSHPPSVPSGNTSKHIPSSNYRVLQNSGVVLLPHSRCEWRVLRSRPQYKDCGRDSGDSGWDKVLVF